MPDVESIIQAPLSTELPLPTEPAVEQAKELPKVPAPTASGNDKIAILKHNLFEVDMARGADYPTARVELAIRNVSQSVIATAVFQATFYDDKGNVVDTVKHTEIELRPETSRLVRITSSIPVYEYDQIASYQVRLVRMTTADIEKLQFRSYEMETTETGEEQVTGVVKNLSQVKTDAAVVATFYDAEKEPIATRVLMLKDLEPNTVRKFDLKYKPQQGDTVISCSLAVGEIAG